MCFPSIGMYLLIQNINYFKMQKQTTQQQQSSSPWYQGWSYAGLSEHQVRVNRMTYIKSQLEMYSTVCVWWGGLCSILVLFLNHTPVDSAPINAKYKALHRTQVLQAPPAPLICRGVSFAIEISIFFLILRNLSRPPETKKHAFLFIWPWPSSGHIVPI